MNYEAFYRDLEVIREQRGQSWHAIWRKLPHNVPHNLKWRMQQGEQLSKPVCEHLAAWSGLNLARYQQEASNAI